MKVTYKKDFVLEGDAKEIAETISQLAKREKGGIASPAVITPKKKRIIGNNHWNYAQDYFMRQNMDTMTKRSIHKEVNNIGPKHTLGSVRTRIWQIKNNRVAEVLPSKADRTLDDILKDLPSAE